MRRRSFRTSMGFNLQSVGFVGLLGGGGPVTPPSSPTYRADTLAYQSYADGRGYSNYDLGQIDAIHAALASAGLPTGANANYHFSSPAFGVKLVGSRASEIGCLFRNPLVEVSAGSGPTWVAAGWQGRNAARYQNNAMQIMGLLQGTGMSTVAAIGDFGAPPPSGFACIAELGPNYNSYGYLLGIEAELYYAASLGSYNLLSEGSTYAAGARYVLGRVDASLPAAQQVQLSTNRIVRAGRLYSMANPLSPPFQVDTVYVGGRVGTGSFLQNATLSALFLSNTAVSDAQAAALNSMAAYYSL